MRIIKKFILKLFIRMLRSSESENVISEIMIDAVHRKRIVRTALLRPMPGQKHNF
jgi:hypothetical protein